MVRRVGEGGQLRPVRRATKPDHSPVSRLGI
jgi:hypothetical protein